MAEMKLRALPDRTLVKRTVVFQPEQNARLLEYAAMYNEEHKSAPEEVEVLIPFMLDAFIESDRAFLRRWKHVEKAATGALASGVGPVP